MNNAMSGYPTGGGGESTNSTNSHPTPNEFIPSDMVTAVVEDTTHICRQRAVMGAPEVDLLSQVLLHYLGFKQPMKDSIEEARLHPAYVNSSLYTESKYSIDRFY